MANTSRCIWHISPDLFHTRGHKWALDDSIEGFCNHFVPINQNAAYEILNIAFESKLR